MTRLLPVGTVILAAFFIRLVQRILFADLFSVSAPQFVTVWPGTVIFGFYFATIFFAGRRLFSFRTLPTFSLLGFLAVVGISGDLVFINISEATRCLPARYGAVVAWDLVSLIVIWTAIEPLSPARPMNPSSFVVLAFPALKVGREILTMGSLIGTGRATFDFYFGDVGLLLGWTALCLYAEKHDQWKSQTLGRRLGTLVLTFGFYWLFVVLENAIELTSGFSWWPGSLWVNATYALLALTTAIIIFPRISMLADQ